MESAIVHVSPEALVKEVSDSLQRIASKYPSVAFVVLIGPKSDASSLACITTVQPQATIDRLRHGLEQAKRERNRVKIPFRE